MDIIFQSGEFYNENSDLFNLLGNLLGALTGAVISGLIAILIFKKGLRQEREKDKEKDQKQIERNRKTFFTLLESITKTVKKQVEEYQDYVDKIKKNPLANIAPKQLAFQDLDRILKFETADIIDLYDYLDFSNDDYLKTIKSLDYLNAVLKTIPEDLWNLKGNNIKNLSTIFIQTKNEILNLCVYYVRDQKLTNPEFNNDPLYQFLNKLVVDYYTDNDGKPDLKYDYDNLINPLKLTLLRDFSFHELAVEVLKRTKIAGDIIFTIKDHYSGFGDDLATAIGQINESTNDLDKLLNKNNS